MISIGKNVKIEPNTVIGEDGFRYERMPNGTLKEIPHEFGVIIEDDVRIGACTTIDNGRWRNTLIQSGSKIDKSAHIGHNVIVGKNCLIHSFVQLCGSCEIGNNCQVFSFSNIQPHVKICDNVTIGDGSIVRQDIKTPGSYVYVGNGKMKKL